jgi:hypothetical protein
MITRFFQDSIVSNPFQKDSLSIPANTSIRQQKDTLKNISGWNDTARRIQLKQKVSFQSLIVVDSSKLEKKDTLIVQIKENEPFRSFNPPVNRFSFFRNGINDIDYKPQAFWVQETIETPEARQLLNIPHHFQRSEFNWTLVIGLFSAILLMALKAYYQKFVNQVINTLVNIQLADKMLREKNIIVRRAFFMMNLNFVLMSGLFVLLLAHYAQFRMTKHYIYDFLIFEAGIICLLLVRIMLMLVGAIIFEKQQLINEQIHSSYLINKNIGLMLLPIVFTAIYTNQIISNVILFSGVIIFAIATLYRLIRGFQIILKNGVLLYYAILYLCTLELLPLVIGSKLLISLR